MFKKKYWFVENLTVSSWCFGIFPRLVKHQISGRSEKLHCLFFYNSSGANTLARLSGRLFRTEVEKLNFRHIDVKDQEGKLIELRIRYEDLAVAQSYVINDPDFENFLRVSGATPQFKSYLSKQVVSSPIYNARTFVVWDVIYLIQVSLWKHTLCSDKAEKPVLFIEPRPWLKPIVRYANESGIRIVAVRGSVNVRNLLRRYIPRFIMAILRAAKYRGLYNTARSYIGQLLDLVSKHRLRRHYDSNVISEDISDNLSRPKLGVPFYGNFNLDLPDRHSDYFFWQQSSLEGNQIITTFDTPNARLNLFRFNELAKKNVKAVVLHPGATDIPGFPIFSNNLIIHKNKQNIQKGTPKGREGKWLLNHHSNYEQSKAFWTELFRSRNIKVFTSWYKHDGVHCAIAEALEGLGGVTTIYQRSFESHPSPQLTIHSDIVFGFSPTVARVEERANSIVKYHVATGYLGDHRFPLLKHRADIMRRKLVEQGAKRIISFSDESTFDDPRWVHGHDVARKDYSFLLEKVLLEPSLGLIIKPKVPGTIKERLGPIRLLLEQALDTGRCMIFDESGDFQASRPPAEAALAADIAIHSTLYSAAAAVEAALVGVPTLMLDHEGWPDSPIYRLGEGKVVFKNWDTLWDSYQEHCSVPGGIPGFGDWTDLIDEIDPFRDGRAAERMGNYIKWLLDGFSKGLNREDVMSEAAEKYTSTWGKGYVNQINMRV